MIFNSNINIENPLALKNNIVYIEGSLIVETNKLPLIGLQSMCCADEYHKQYANQVIKGNLHISDKNVIEYSSFTTFIAKGDIIYYQCEAPNLPFPLGEIDVCKERQSEFYQLLDSVNDDSPQLLLQLLYASVFSRYEYAIILYILYFLRYRQNEIISFFQKRNRASELNRLIKSDIPDGNKELEIMSFIRENIYTGNSKFLQDLLFTILDTPVEVPVSLKEGYLKRNSIIHRAGCNTYGYPILITKNDIKSISKDIDDFITYLNNIHHSKEKAWVDSVRSELGLPPL